MWTVEDSGIFSGARQILFNTNLLGKGKKGLNPYAEALDVLESVQWNMRPENKFVVTSVYGDTSWKPPEVEYVKINVDGAWDGDTKKDGIGLCCRDDSRVILFVESCSKVHLSSSLEAKLWSLQRSLEIAEEKRSI
ncbi:hypothetical protein QQ045_020566 [Rhodiola kirilowii]